MPELTTCPIWDTTAENRGSKDYGRNRGFVSPRAGGFYVLSGVPDDVIERLPPGERAKLTTWIAEQNLAGLDAHITLEFLNDVLPHRRAMSVSERMDNLLRFIARNSSHLGDFVNLRDDMNYDLAVRACVACECISFREIDFLIQELANHGYLTSRDDSIVVLTSSGYSRLSQLDQVNADSTQAFVAMWFDPSMKESYISGIEPGIADAGYKALRIDKKEHNNKIDDEIIAEIRRSRFVVSDFTSEPEKPRGGVYFEAGFAKGLGLEVIWTCRQDLIKRVHFRYAANSRTSSGRRRRIYDVSLRCEYRRRLGWGLCDRQSGSKCALLVSMKAKPGA